LQRARQGKLQDIFAMAGVITFVSLPKASSLEEGPPDSGAFFLMAESRPGLAAGI